MADGTRVEPVRHAELHGAENEQRAPAGGGQARRGDDLREADQEREDVAKDDRLHGRAILLVAQGEGHDREADPGRGADEIARQAGQPQAVRDEKSHPGQDCADGEPVGAVGPLTEEPRAEERDPDRGGVLEQDRVGRSRHLGGRDECDRAGRVGHGAEHLHAGEVKTQRPADHDQEDGSDDASSPGDGERRPVDGLDQQPPEAPAQRGEEQLGDGTGVSGNSHGGKNHSQARQRGRQTLTEGVNGANRKARRPRFLSLTTPGRGRASFGGVAGGGRSTGKPPGPRTASGSG